jgi:hypothetical protein
VGRAKPSAMASSASVMTGYLESAKGEAPKPAFQAVFFAGATRLLGELGQRPFAKTILQLIVPIGGATGRRPIPHGAFTSRTLHVRRLLAAAHNFARPSGFQLLSATTIALSL